jgi:FkbM family methyltransferase
MKDLLRAALRWMGYEVHSYTPLRNHDLRRARLLRERRIDTVLDGGANAGQYATRLRKLGYTGRIVSVEPIPSVFAELAARAEGDERWECVNAALAREPGRLELRVAAISEVSSILPATGAVHTEGWTATRPVSVPGTTVDALLQGAERAYIKLDLQGYELEALGGAAASLQAAVALEVELSTVPLYEGAALLPEVVRYVTEQGYSLFSAEPALVDYDSGRVLQLDGIFIRD